MAWSNNLFFVVFLSQILLISWYFPRRLLARMQRVLEEYPPHTYSKLYPRPVEDYRIAQWKFRLFNRLILGLGFGVLVAVMFVVDHGTFADDGHISELFPAAYGMIQFLPLLALEFSEFSHTRLMRKANTSTLRKAELTRRGLFDFVSPVLLAVTLAFFAGAIWFDLWAHDYELVWGHDTMERAIVLTFTNLFLVGAGAFTLLTRTRDPHQSAADRFRKLRASLTSLLFCSMALSVFFVTAAADDVFDIDFLDAILMSVYFQAVVWISLGYMLQSIRLEDIDFDVYRNDVAVT